MADNIRWTRIVDPRERYRIVYRDRDGELSERNIELQKIGEFSHETYFGVTHAGGFKTLRADRIVAVLQQLTQGHGPSIHPMPNYAMDLPKFPLENAVYKMPTVAVSHRTWTVDLNRYMCACPEKRIRAASGYEPGKLGFVCPHMARAILDYLPAGSPGWSPELLKFVADPRKVHIDNLT